MLICVMLIVVEHTQGAQFSFGDTLRKFARPEGISFTVAASSGHGTESVSYQGYLLVISGDTLAVAELIGFKRGFSSTVHSPCWQCNCKGVPPTHTHLVRAPFAYPHC